MRYFPLKFVANRFEEVPRQHAMFVMPAGHSAGVDIANPSLS